MNDEQKGIIVDNFVKLAECLKCSDEFSCHFIQKRIFTANDINELLLKHGQSRSMKFLMDVQKRGSYAFDVLYDALVATCQFDLADILKPKLAPSWPNARLGSVGAQVVDAGPVVGGGPGACGRCGAPQSRDVRDPNSEKPDYQLTVQLDDDGDLSDSLESLDNSNTHLDAISLLITLCRKPRIRTLFNTKSPKDIVRWKSRAAHKSGDHARGQQPTYEAFPRDIKQLYLFPGYNPERPN